MSKNKLQMSLIIAIAAMLVFPANSLVLAQVNNSPIVTVPADFAVEATSPSGALVTYSATASDIEDGALTPSCIPPSNSTFPLGPTLVTCTAADSANHTSSASFTVTVVDTTSPTIVAPSAIVVEGNTTGGANNVSLGTPTVADIVDPSPSVTNDAPAIFPLGTTIFTWQATDASGNSANATQNVTVTDTTAPSIIAPLPITVEASTSSGTPSTDPAIAAFLSGAIALDTVDDELSITDDAPTIFPLGTTMVTFTATDDSSNSANDTSTITVVDTELPSISITQPLNGTKFNTGNVTVTGTVSDITIVSVEVLVGNVSKGNATLNGTSWSKPLVLTDGSHTIKARATDSANNTASAEVSIVVDTTSPTITITSPLNGSTLNSTNVNITGTASDADGLTSVHVSIDSGTFVLANGTTSWSFNTTMTVGNHTITAKATDMVGNTDTVSISISIQTPQTPPPPPPSTPDIGTFSCDSQSIRGNLIIDGLDVSLNNCDVRGNIRISNGKIMVAEGSNIRGNFVLTNSDVEVKDSEVRGNFRIAGGSLILTGNTIRGQVKVCGSTVIEISDNVFRGGIKFCAEGEELDDAVEEAKYTKVDKSSKQQSKNDEKGKKKNEQVGPTAKNGGKDTRKNDTDKKADDKSKSSGNGNSGTKGKGKGNSGGNDKGSSGKGNGNGKGNSGNSSDKGEKGKDKGNGNGNGKGKGK